MSQTPKTAVTAPVNAFMKGGFTTTARDLPEEVPIALSFAGSTYAVMMATPADFEDFAIGFTLNEDIAKQSDIEGIEIVPFDDGIDLQIRLAAPAKDALATRRRMMAGPVGCGLCGVESIAGALRPTPRVESATTITPTQIAEAMAALATHQTLNAKTRAVHAAGFYRPGVGTSHVREDVGRHNALDKMIGALHRDDLTAAAGVVLLTSRVSVEMVQKTAACGSPILVAISAPTALAVRTAEAAHITLIGVTRGDEFEIFSHPERVFGGDEAQ